MKSHLIILAVVTLAFTSCGTTKNETMNNSLNKSVITQSFWVLETLEGQQINNSGNSKEIGFKLDAENNRVTGFTGCNNIMGEYVLEEGNRIRFLALGTTRMACPDLSFNESDLMKVFSEADNYSINGDRLELNVGKSAPLAVFRKAKTSLEPIEEKYWKLKTLEGKEVVMGENQEREVYFILKTHLNRVTGFAGCNTISGTYTLEKGDRIKFSHLATTMKACPDVDFKEHEFLKIFEIADNYRITDDKLELYVGKRAPLAVFEALYFD